MGLIKRKPYNTILTYHGCVQTRSQVLLYREHIDDFISEVINMISLGYTPVLPSIYMSWRTGSYTPPTPIFLIRIDDGLDTLRIFGDWCLSQKIPFGLALITARQHKMIPEEDFISWANVKRYVDSGYAEVMCHTHDQHSLAPLLQTDGDFGSVLSATSTTITLDAGASTSSGFYNGQNLGITGGLGAGQNFMVESYNGSTQIATIAGSFSTAPNTTSTWAIAPIVSSPILEGPCWLDNGLILHRDTGDTRYAWDNSYTSDCFGFPLIGTDPYDGTTKVVSTVTFTPTTSFRLSVIRFVSTLVVPAAGGYAAQVQVKLNGVVCDTIYVYPKNYGFITQWPEREYVMMNLPNSTQFTNAGVPNTITFTTLNVGNALLRCYFYPGSSTHTVSAQTNCQSLDHGLIGPQYADEPAGVSWVGKPLMILGDGTGSVELESNFTIYVQADVSQFQADVQKWLNATWTHYRNDPPTTIGGDGVPEYNAIGTFGTYLGAGAVSMAFPLPVMPNGTVVDVIEIKAAGLNRLLDQHPYSCIIRIDTSVDNGSTWQQGYYGLANWNEFRWIQYDVTPFTVGTHTALIRFTTITASQWGADIIAQIYLTLPDAIPLTGAYSAASNSATIPRYMVYPFGGSYELGNAVFTRPTNTEDIAPAFKTALMGGQCNCGFTITPKRAALDSDYREPDAGGTVWVLGGQIIYGTNDPSTTIQHNEIYAGQYFPDVRHGGVIWSTAIEANPGGCSSILQSVGILDEVHFDAWNFDGAGNIVEGIINDGGTYCQFDIAPTGNYTAGETVTQTPSGYTATVVWSSTNALKISGMSTQWLPSLPGAPQTVTGNTSGITGVIDNQGAVTYADDKAFLQSHSVPCYLIFFNYNPVIGDIDPAIASYVVNHPSAYIPKMVSILVANNWEGMMYDIEATPQADRAAATSFIQQLYAACQTAGKKLTVAVPLFTNTAYDIGSEDFWGWCDFSAVIASCDQMLCESYLENSGTLPGAACPDDIFNLYYLYLQEACYLGYWDRIRVGCNIYGQYWPDKTSTDNVSYDSYHIGYANLIYGGTLASIVDTEMTFQDKLGGEGWYGTPLTVQRAIKKATIGQFGGIFIWEADKGDKYEFWPSVRGPKENYMNFSESVIPIVQSYFAIEKPGYDATVQKSFNGKENRIANWTRPLSTYLLQARDFIPGDTTTSYGDYLNFRNFWLCVAQGESNGFRFRFSGDCTLTNELIGTGDAAQHTFQIIKTYSFDAQTYVRNIYKPVTYGGNVIKVYLNGVLQLSGYTVDATTGLVSFVTAPGAGVLITITCIYDVPVRSGQRELPMTYDMDYGVVGLDDFTLYEIDIS